MPKKATSSKSVYCLRHPERYSAEVLDVVLDILNNYGPKPMRNFKPSQKHPTAADTFWAEHQHQYEVHGANSDRVVDVHQHNTAYPKLRDELDKRRSLVKINTTDAKTVTATKRWKGTSKPMKKTIGKRNANKSRRKRAKDVKRLAFSRIKTHRSSQCYHRSENKGTSPEIFGNNQNDCHQLKENSNTSRASAAIMKNNPNIKNTANVGITSMDIENLKRKYENDYQNHDGEAELRNSDSDGDSGYPDTSAPSLKTYNSNMSMDHEPMV